MVQDLKGLVPESWHCVDCGVDTAPGCLGRAEMEQALRAANSVQDLTFDEQSEVYTVRDAVWAKAGMTLTDGCLCIGCLEHRLGRRLKPKDFKRDDPLNDLACTARLLNRQKRSP
jgi:hypothetical protein